jgi:hypothetical protein
MLTLQAMLTMLTLLAMLMMLTLAQALVLLLPTFGMLASLLRVLVVIQTHRLLPLCRQQRHW